MRILNCVLLAGVSGLSLTTMLGGTAFAQSAGQPAIAASDTANADDVIVTGVRASLRNALAIKRSSDLISDVISTKDIGQLPDVTIAEELNRLPGINTTRDRGNASQASVRGLGPRFVFGLVNGREVASSEPSQDVRWEAYPSEVLSGAQVYKTQDAGLVPVASPPRSTSARSPRSIIAAPRSVSAAARPITKAANRSRISAHGAIAAASAISTI